MDCQEVSRPIYTTLTRPNYIHWAQAMTSFLQAHKVWRRIITREVTELTQKKDESEESFGNRKEDWIAKNGDINTWSRNTLISSINQ